MSGELDGCCSTRYDLVSETEKAFGMPLNCDLILSSPLAMDTYEDLAHARWLNKGRPDRIMEDGSFSIMRI